MKQIIDIPVLKARQLIQELGLNSGDYFTNTEPSELCYEYRIETGYWLSKGKERLVKLTTTKDENDKEVTKARVEINLEAFGIDPDERSPEADEVAQKILNQVCSIIEHSPIKISDVKYS